MMTKNNGVSIGETLKLKRKEQNLSLKEVENATSIRSNYIESIEKGEWQKLISPIYAQGFIRQYATFLGMDGEAVIRDNLELFQKKEDQEFSYGIGTLETRGHPGAGVKWLPNALWIGAFALILVAAWYLARFLEVV